MTKQHIPYQTNEKAFAIRKIRANFDAASINEQPHRHEFTEFLYIKSGSGKQEIDGREYDLENNTFYIISKGQVHHFLYAKNIEGTLIRFQDSILPAVQSSNEGFYYNLLSNLRHHNQAVLLPKDRQLVELLLQRMLEEYDAQSSNTLDLSLIQHLLYPLIILMNRHVKAEVNVQDYKQDLYTDFLQLLEQSFKKHHNLGFYSFEMGLSNTRLTYICRVKSGKTAKKLISERIILEAKRLIKYTTLPLKEIAAQLGYNEVAYFCRAFKREAGLPPSQYKMRK